MAEDELENCLGIEEKKAYEHWGCEAKEVDGDEVKMIQDQAWIELVPEGKGKGFGHRMGAFYGLRRWFLR